MQLSQFLHLEGHGYLENVYYHESKCIVKLKSIHTEYPDEIYLDCEVQGILEDHLLNLEQEVKKGNSVIVSFNAAFHKIESIYPLYDDEGEPIDEDIIIFKCTLKSLGNCYINGSLVDKEHFRFLKAA